MNKYKVLNVGKFWIKMNNNCKFKIPIENKPKDELSKSCERG